MVGAAPGSAHPLVLQTLASREGRTRGICGSGVSWGSWRMGWEAGDAQLCCRPLSCAGGSVRGAQGSACAQGAPCMHAHPRAWQRGAGSACAVSPVLWSCGGKAGTLRAHREPRCTAKGCSPSAARSAFLAELGQRSPGPGFAPHPGEMREIPPGSITATPGAQPPSPPASHGPALPF